MQKLLYIKVKDNSEVVLLTNDSLFNFLLDLVCNLTASNRVWPNRQDFDKRYIEP